MESSLKQLLDKAVLDKMEWETVTMPFPSSDGNNFNLCDYIGLDCSRSRECFFFPEEYNSCSKETRDSLAKTLKIAAAHGRFPLVQRGWDAGMRRMRLERFRSRVHNKETCKQSEKIPSENRKRNISFKQPQKGKECPFRFSIYWVPERVR